MDFSALLNKMFVFVVLMLIGYILARRGVLGQDFTRIGSKLAVDVFMVGTILGAMFSAGESVQAEGLLQILLLTGITQAIGFAVAALVMRFVHLEKDRAGALEVLMGIGNTIFIALPIASALYGNYAVLIVSVSCIPFNLLLYSWGAWRAMGGGKGRKIRMREIFSVPLITTLVGILMLVLRIPVPKAIRDLMSSLGGATMPVSMLVIGVSLGSVSLLDAFRNPHLALLSAVRLLLVPVVTWFVLRTLTEDSVLLMTCTIMAASPSAVVASILAIQCGQDPLFSSEGVQHSTLCSVITIPLLVRLLSGLG